MREIRLYGSEGGGAAALPTPIPTPIVKRRDAAAEIGVSVPSKSHLSAKCVFHVRNFVTAAISIRVVVWARPKMSNLQGSANRRCSSFFAEVER